MQLDSRSLVDDDGRLQHTFEYDQPYDGVDSVVLTFSAEDDAHIVCRAYDGEEDVYQTSFQRRALSFDPISVIGRGETERLEGVTAGDGDEREAVPEAVQVACNAVGFSVVPSGEWWLSE